MSLVLDEPQLKKLFKQAMLELFQERKDIFQDLFAEALEEFALARAIKEGEDTDSVSRDEVFALLEGISA